jgi:hypothetical protein
MPSLRMGQGTVPAAVELVAATVVVEVDMVVLLVGVVVLVVRGAG